jgi:hypothetical protein
MTKQKTASAIIHAHDGPTDAVYMALLEQLFEMEGPTVIASLLSARLRDSDPHPGVIAAVARLLDPQGNESFKLVVVRRRRGESLTKEVNDIAIAKQFAEFKQALGGKHGSLKKAIGETADLFKVSEAKVRKAIRSIPK